MNSAWASWSCCFLKGSLKHDFLDIYLTASSESVISEIQKLWESSFFSKSSKFNVDFENAAKSWQKLFFSQIIASELVSLNFLYLDRLLFIGSQCVNKQSQDFACQSERHFAKQFPFQSPINLIKVLWCRFQQRLGTFAIMLIEASSEAGLFRHLSDYVFGVPNFEKKKSMMLIFSFKMFKV